MDLDPEVSPPQPLADDADRTASEEGVEHAVAGIRAGEDAGLDQVRRKGRAVGAGKGLGGDRPDAPPLAVAGSGRSSALGALQPSIL